MNMIYGDYMLDVEELERYYLMKEERDKLDSHIKRLKIKIVDKMLKDNILTDSAENYFAELEYETNTTKTLVNFAKEHKEFTLITETVSKKSYEILKKKYHFTPEQEKDFLATKGVMPKLHVNLLKKPIKSKISEAV
jgi:hypothetical protein